jgi:hypothetical protein
VQRATWLAIIDPIGDFLSNLMSAWRRCRHHSFAAPRRSRESDSCQSHFEPLRTDSSSPAEISLTFYGHSKHRPGCIIRVSCAPRQAAMPGAGNAGQRAERRQRAGWLIEIPERTGTLVAKTNGERPKRQGVRRSQRSTTTRLFRLATALAIIGALKRSIWLKRLGYLTGRRLRNGEQKVIGDRWIERFCAAHIVDHTGSLVAWSLARRVTDC